MNISYSKSCFKAGFVLFTFLLFSTISQAQVGIGNTSPAASSALDITSTTQGLLAPRMTTAERVAITTPANSLLVYDITLKSFYYYDTTVLPAPGSWIKINAAANQRNNFKLVKSAADLAPELTAGGSTYKLTSNTYYEINGTITLTAPIDLNNAYISGLDANEDVLDFTAGTVFAGNTGGSIRNITIKGAKAFNITGPGIATSTSLLIQNTIVDGMTTSVGSISGFGLYFGNINQFINNTNGITYSNIGNLLLSNQAWLSTNIGTFEKFTGNFGLVEKASGFSTANGTAVALDVSTTGLAVSNGVLIGTVFSGTSTTYIKGYAAANTYPGYNFSNAWTVNCPGIPRESDDVATGDINLNAAVGSGALTTFSGTGTGSRKKVSGTTTSNSLFRFIKDGDNKIIYDGSKKRYFQISASVSYQATDDITAILYIAKNGSVVTETKVYGRGSTGFFTSAGILALPIIGTIELAKGDFIEIWAERYSGSGNMQTLSLNLTAR
ncbi:hypothetical protein [Aequorivita sp. CIP111184]|uniref:hypothetical protein n=1 Tax=Aequorivita sp. CIP111184 TaxID=2211356 RepID=UPI000DBBB5EF|nr:hypothetical protein [Aequorivita sp. CIP111184]SRX52897.1 hypothetical protein AEQU1_00752 [Aequorivita sp. CIP111184]